MRSIKRIFAILVCLIAITISALACSPGLATASADNNNHRAYASTLATSTCSVKNVTVTAKVFGTYTWGADPYTSISYEGSTDRRTNDSASSTYQIPYEAIFKTVKNTWTAKCNTCGGEGKGTAIGTIN